MDEVFELGLSFRGSGAGWLRRRAQGRVDFNPHFSPGPERAEIGQDGCSPRQREIRHPLRIPSCDATERALVAVWTLFLDRPIARDLQTTPGTKMSHDQQCGLDGEPRSDFDDLERRRFGGPHLLQLILVGERQHLHSLSREPKAKETIHTEVAPAQDDRPSGGTFRLEMFLSGHLELTCLRSR